MVGEEENVEDSNVMPPTEWFDNKDVHKAFATLFTYYNNHKEYTRSKAEKDWLGAGNFSRSAEGQAILTGHYPRADDEHTSAEPIMILPENLNNAEIIKYYNHYSWISGLKMPVGNDGNFYKNEWEHVLPIFHQMIFAGGLAGFSYWDITDFRINESNKKSQSELNSYLVNTNFENINTYIVDPLASNPLTSSQIYHRIKQILNIDDDRYKSLAINKTDLNLLCIAKSEKFLNQCKSDSVFVCLKKRNGKYEYTVDTERIKDFFNGISLDIVANPDMNFQDEIWNYGLRKNNDGDLIRAPGKPSNHSYKYITKGAKNHQEISLGLCLRDDFIANYTEKRDFFSAESEQIRNEFKSWKEMAINNVTKILGRIVHELNQNMIERTLFNCIYLLCYSNTKWDSETHNDGDVRGKYRVLNANTSAAKGRSLNLNQLEKITMEETLPTGQDPEDDTIITTEVFADPGLNISERDTRSSSKKRKGAPTGTAEPAGPASSDRSLINIPSPQRQGDMVKEEFGQRGPSTPNQQQSVSQCYSSIHLTPLSKQKEIELRSIKPIEYFVGKCIRHIYPGQFQLEMTDDDLTNVLGESLDLNFQTILSDSESNSEFEDKVWQKIILKHVLTDCINTSYRGEPKGIVPTGELQFDSQGGSSKRVLKTKRGKKKLGYKKRK
tara:strand:- start:5609 stop:7609 length:2001 start_codon:yes stop_codon:yes gene_type:complete